MGRHDILKRKDEILSWIKESDNKISNSEISRRLGCKYDTWKRYNSLMNINYDGNQPNKGRHHKEIFIRNSSSSTLFVKNILITEKIFEYRCNKCKINEWNNQPINLELDHINGDNRDNRIENLRFLCPNCHSQTETFRGKGINSGVKKVSDDKLIDALKTTSNIRQALFKVGLTPRGGNYTRCRELMEKCS